MQIDDVMALVDEYVSASIEDHGYRSGAASAEYLEDTKRKLLAALESLIAAPAAPQRNREADRARYTDPAFNEWLDDSVADGGATVWDLVPDVHSAWFAWTAHPNYAAPQQVEPVAWMKPTRDSCYLRSAETMLAIHEDFDGIARTGWTPLYLHPPPAEVQAGACPHCGSDCNERDELTKAEREITRLRAEVEALRENNHGWLRANGPGGWIDALRADAERWEHARSIACFTEDRDMGPGGWWTVAVYVKRRPAANTIDAAVDAARAAQGDKT